MEAGEGFGSERRGGVFGFGVLDLGAVGGFVPGMGGMLRACRWWMLKCLEGVGDVAWHGDVDVSVDIVPVECEAAVELACPVFCDRVERLEGVDEVLGMVIADVLDSEVIDHECEGNGSRAVAEESGCVGGGEVSMVVEVGDEAVVRKDAGLG